MAMKKPYFRQILWLLPYIAFGCQVAPPPGAVDVMRAMPDRSLVFAPASIHEVDQQRIPWYAVRKDVYLSTYSGTLTATTEEISTITYERLSQHGTRIHDHIHTQIYRSSSTRSMR